MLHLIGAGGHASVVVDVALRLGRGPIMIWGERTPPPGRFPPGVTYAPRDEFDAVQAALLGVGGLDARRELRARYPRMAAALVDPSAVMGWNVTVGLGALIMPGCVVNANADIGEDVILNTAVVVEHDCRVGRNSHLSPGVRVSGECTIGNEAHLGTGAILLPGVTIGDGAVVGAGAVVRDNVEPGSVVVGVPARRIR